MQGQPLIIDAPEPEAKPPEVPTTEGVSNTPPEAWTGPSSPGDLSENIKKSRGRKTKDEFDRLGDIQEAFRAMPSNAARQRAWEWITGWLAEEYPVPQPQAQGHGSLVAEMAESLYGIR